MNYNLSVDKEKPKNGLYIERYDNDQLKFEQNYKDGNLHGRFISWYKSGQKKSEGNYEDGSHQGKWTFWNENGDAEGWTHYRPPNVKKFIRPHKVIIFLLLILKIILDFLDFHDFWLLFSEPLIYISGILIGIFGFYTYKQFIRALAIVSIVAFAIIVYQSPIWTSMSIFINIMRFFDILLVALLINIMVLNNGTNKQYGTRRSS